MAAEVVSIEGEGAAAARAALEDCVRAGGVAVFPADGLYGVCCDPLDASAIGRIHLLKGREPGKPSAVMYFAPLVMREVLRDLGPRAREAIGALMPGPVTVVVANPARRYPLACGDDPARLGLRLIEGPLAGAGVPIFQTSANRSGAEAASRLADVDPAIVGGADLAIDGGELTGLPSTVIDVSELDDGGGWRILREGALGTSEVAARLGAISSPRR
jgi:L-threonylcarbamoyladenylate synthase